MPGVGNFYFVFPCLFVLFCVFRLQLIWRCQFNRPKHFLSLLFDLIEYNHRILGYDVSHISDIEYRKICLPLVLYPTEKAFRVAGLLIK